MLIPFQAQAYSRGDYPGPRRGYVAHPPGFPDDHDVKRTAGGLRCTVPLAVATWGDVRVVVRAELKPLVETLLRLTETRYGYDIRGAETGGFNCRYVRGSNSISNHAYGRAIDINSSKNPRDKVFTSDIPPAVVDLWMRHGFYWGGHYPTRYDTMRFEFMDSLASIAAHTANASREAGDPTPPQPNPPQACATLRSYPPIGQGARGTAVTVAQCQLKAARHAIVVDGVFGAQTKAEVVAYQRARGLVADGQIGQHTWTSLLAQGGTPGLQEGSRGDDVIRLQRALRASGQSLSVDGQFGAQTKAAVVAYQKRVGLAADGVVGPQTRAALQAGR